MIWIVLGVAKSNENDHLKLMHHKVANHESLRNIKNIMFPSHIELDNISKPLTGVNIWFHLGNQFCRK
jgi:hypothetical protein